MKILLVGNPTSQSGRNAARIQSAQDALIRRGHSVQYLATEPEGRTVAAVAGAVDGGDCELAVYMGGDGTFADVAKGLLDAGRTVPLGMLPSGTANNQGKSFGIVSDVDALEENLAIIEQGYLCQLDVGHIRRLDATGRVTDTDRFFDSAGFGMQSAILVGRNQDRELVAGIPLLREIYRDKAVYVGATLREYLRSYVEPVKFDAHIKSDAGDHVWTGLTDVIVSATAVYGGLWVPARHGAPDDGLFDVIPMQGRRDMLSKLLRDLKDLPLWQEDLDDLGITHSEGFSAAKLDIELIRPLGDSVKSQLDGEEWIDGDRFQIEVEPGALPIIVRRDWTPPWAE
jgi:diacylglycerol kinase family enzyme